MAETFKQEEKPVIKLSPVIRRVETDLYSSFESLTRAASIKPREYSTTIRKADLNSQVLANKEKYDDPSNPISRRFAALVEKV